MLWQVYIKYPSASLYCRLKGRTQKLCTRNGNIIINIVVAFVVVIIIVGVTQEGGCFQNYIYFILNGPTLAG